MTRYQGGSTVPGGYFLDLRHWSFRAVSGDEGQLPGDETSRYVKVPLIAVIPGVLLISLAFLVFFPFIGFALAGKAAFNALRGVAQGAADATLAGSMTPGEAYLAGEPEEKDPAAPKPADAELAQLQHDIKTGRDTER
jgi:hypothetical protein